MTLRELLSLTSKPTDMQLWVYEDYQARMQIAIIDIHETWGSYDRRQYLAEELLDMTVGRIRLAYREDESAYLSVDIYVHPGEEES